MIYKIHYKYFFIKIYFLIMFDCFKRKKLPLIKREENAKEKQKELKIKEQELEKRDEE